MRCIENRLWRLNSIIEEIIRLSNEGRKNEIAEISDRSTISKFLKRFTVRKSVKKNSLRSQSSKNDNLFNRTDC